jgi:hypothetical protein
MLIALLAWYDEPVADLERAIESCAGTVDWLIALDGRYESFRPGAPVNSPVEQVRAIERACSAAGIVHTIQQPQEPWQHEGVKRSHLFTVAQQIGTIGEDWLLPIDADEELRNTDALREYLAGSAAREHTAAAFYYHTPGSLDAMDAEERAVTIAGTETRSYTQVRLLRLQRGLHVVPPTHYLFACDDGPVTRAQFTFPPDSFHILHHTMSRPMERKRLKAQHIKRRGERGER